MVTTRTGLAGMIARYARVFHGAVGRGHHVASPLGAWLLLALAAPATQGREREELTGILGCGADEAAGLAAGLLAAPHPLVAAAAAVWNRPGAGDAEWLAGLPGGIDRGDIPSQAELDEWARRRTFGLVDRFPVDLEDRVYLLLATALATKVSWDCPFETAPASALGAKSPWAGSLSRVLRSPDHPGHVAFIAATAQAGDVAVHVGAARGGLAVASVIAAPDVAPADVLAAAHEVATAHVLGQPAGQRSLFALPLGDGPAWSIREEMSDAGGGERCTAFLPAWSARSEHDLAAPALGYTAAAAALGKGDPWEAKQAAVARYSRIGFEAGAVTAMAVMLSMVVPPRGLLRVAELRFGHPYAVVAVAADEEDGGGRPGRRGRPARGAGGRGPWHGVPVFSAWITEPGDAGIER